MNATVILVRRHGLTAELDAGQPWPNATNQVQVHEAYSPGASTHAVGDRIKIQPGPDGIEASLEWREEK